MQGRKIFILFLRQLWMKIVLKAQVSPAAARWVDLTPNQLDA